MQQGHAVPRAVVHQQVGVYARGEQRLHIGSRPAPHGIPQFALQAAPTHCP